MELRVSKSVSIETPLAFSVLERHEHPEVREEGVEEQQLHARERARRLLDQRDAQRDLAPQHERYLRIA